MTVILGDIKTALEIVSLSVALLATVTRLLESQKEKISLL
jgi:hypothetical protein